MDPKQITIAITVYNRRDYIQEAVASALGQTTPVQVIVVEDCGPDAGLEGFVKREFGSRIDYIRNPRRRGLFGNWNACLELCRTEWLSILHDDDFLAPGFVNAMIQLAAAAPGLELYFGQTVVMDESRKPMPGIFLRPVHGAWMRRGLADVIFSTPFPFPGQLFSKAAAQDVGGFCVNSYYCGDWQMWAKLMARTGAAQTAEVVAFNRGHDGWDRGSNKVMRDGILTPASYVQHKRILALMPAASRPKFDRVRYQRLYAIPIYFLLRHGASLSPRLLRYHVKLLWLTPAPHWRYAGFKWLTRVLGVGFVRRLSRLWNHLAGARQNPA